MKTLLIAALVPFALLLDPRPAAAQEAAIPTPGATSVTGIRGEAMGNAFRGFATTNEALFVNAGAMAQAARYELDLGYAFDTGNDLSRFSASIVDAQTSRLVTGLAYTRISADGATGALSGNLVHLGFAVGLGTPAGVGVTFKYLDVEQDAGTIEGTPADDTNAITADVGALVRAGELVRVGIAAYNLIDVASRQAPRQIAAGVAVGPEDLFHVTADGVIDISGGEELGWSAHLGGEVLLDETFALRAGGQHVAIPAGLEGRSYVSAGAGIVVDSVAAEVAFVQNVTSGQTGDRLFGLGLKLFL